MLPLGIHLPFLFWRILLPQPMERCSVHLVEDSPQLLSLLRNYIKLYTHKYISLTVPNLAKLKAKINIPLSLIIKK